jgi:hypothetical protein
MTPSAAHLAAREAAARNPANAASLALLAGGQGAIRLYDGGATLIGTIPLASPAGTLDSGLYRIILTVPVEGMILAAGPIAGADIRAGDGADWATGLTVSVVDEGGELQFDTLAVQPGDFARLVAGVIQG